MMRFLLSISAFFVIALLYLQIDSSLTLSTQLGILFGKDAYKVSEYYTYFRVLETDDEYFDYYRKRHAHWKMYGLALPDSILKKIYFKNALRLFPTIDSKLFKPAL